RDQLTRARKQVGAGVDVVAAGGEVDVDGVHARTEGEAGGHPFPGRCEASSPGPITPNVWSFALLTNVFMGPGLLAALASGNGCEGVTAAPADVRAAQPGCGSRRCCAGRFRFRW